MPGRRLGFVLSGSTSTLVRFQPYESSEDSVHEGMLVVIVDGDRRLLGTITRVKLYHEFYEAGEIWGEALRRGHKLPEAAARRYTVAYIQLHGRIGGRGLSAIDRPPKPGSIVYEASGDELQSLYGYRPGNEPPPENVIEVGQLYGYATSNSLPAVLNLDNITMHMAVVGVTGSGKSNTIGVLIEELGTRNGIKVAGISMKTIPAIIFDANGDYIDYYDDPSLVPSYTVYRLVFPQAYGRLALSQAGGHLDQLIIDLNVYRNSLYELAEAIYALTRGGSIEGLELQLDLLTDIIAEAASKPSTPCPWENGMADLNCLFADSKGVRTLEEVLEKARERKIAHQATVDAVRRAIRVFHAKISQYGVVGKHADMATVNEEFVETVVDPDAPGLVIVDFSADGAPGVELKVKQFVLGYMVRLLFNMFVRFKLHDINRVALVVIEEAQNYAPNQYTYPIGHSVARNILALAATQGRKFGLSLLFATQRPSFVDPVIMSMANTFIIHRVAPGDISFVEKVTGGLPNHVRPRLSTLETGLAIVVGQMSVFPTPTLTKIRKRRRHQAGTVGG